VAMSELTQRWMQIFSTLQAGGEVPPGFRLRTEGIMETLCLLKIADAQTQTEAMEACYQAAYGSSLGQKWGEDWQQLFPFPQIPAFAERAPVYPSAPK
jgi:hypothetical protein